jgi:RNA polymerase sigma-70 factor (family 1)
MNLGHYFERLADDDVSAFTEIYNRYYDRIFQLAFAYAKLTELAEDVAQQVFLKLWERRKELRKTENPEGWLFRAAKYQVWTILQREAGRKEYQDKIVQMLYENGLSPDQQIFQKEQVAIINEAINTLTPKQQEVYRLGRESGMTYQQIADKLNIGKETVKEHMFKALKALRNKLESHKDILLIVILHLFF